MPRYNYKCLDCKETLILFHGISELPGHCEKCNSENLKKLLSKPYFKSTTEETKKQQTGEIVNSSIEEFRQDLKKQKESMLNEARTND